MPSVKYSQYRLFNGFVLYIYPEFEFCVGFYILQTKENYFVVFIKAPCFGINCTMLETSITFRIGLPY